MILKGNPYLFSSRDTLDFTIGVDVYATYAELAVGLKIRTFAVIWTSYDRSHLSSLVVLVSAFAFGT